MSNPSDECGKQVGGRLHSRAVNFLSTAPVTPCKSTTKRWLSNCECNHRFDHGGGVFERSEIWYVQVGIEQLMIHACQHVVVSYALGASVYSPTDYSVLSFLMTIILSPQITVKSYNPEHSSVKN